MRMRSPTSRGSFRLRLSAFDIVWALIAPLLAIFIRDTDVFFRDGGMPALLYCSLTFSLSLLAFLGFRIRESMTRHFAVYDALQVAKAVAIAELVTALVLFSVTRLDGIPRSTPTIHALVLLAGLIGVRLLMRVSGSPRHHAGNRHQTAIENIVVVGATTTASRFIALLESCGNGERRVVAVFDDNPHNEGRSLAGVRVAGSANEMEPVLRDFEEHGVSVGRVLIGGSADSLSADTLDEIRRICCLRNLSLDFIPDLINLPPLQETSSQADLFAPEPAVLAVPVYFQSKRVIDTTVSAMLLLLGLPIWILLATVVLLDVGSPILFWQQRTGLDGRTFLLWKFRSLKPSVDGQGRPIPNADRVSWIGHLLRRLHLDEVPQLLNVLVGDMSLIGPRPLLPQDQPANSSLRLSVRPGITGWAQVNGGASLTPAEKSHYDEHYIRHASVWLDLRIVWLTILFLLGRRAGSPSLTDSTAALTDRFAHTR